jgi:hypothetical protein
MPYATSRLLADQDGAHLFSVKLRFELYETL